MMRDLETPWAEAEWEQPPSSQGWAQAEWEEQIWPTAASVEAEQAAWTETEWARAGVAEAEWEHLETPFATPEWLAESDERGSSGRESSAASTNELLHEDGTIAHQCRPGEGPPAAPPGPRPLIHRSVAAVRSRNPSVGYAQQLLNRFLEQVRSGTATCGDTRPATRQYIGSLHAQLRRNGQDPLVVDCRFGPSTELATKMFQACKGLLRDGKIGPRTWPLLELGGPQPHLPTVVTREDVWALSRQDVWHPSIRWYACAVGALKQLGTDLSSSNPQSWGHLANIHSDQCEHGNWQFLAWHRIYLHHFEKVVRDAVIRCGGPASWALPFWNYHSGDREEVLALPPAFRQPQLPDGRPNPLFESQRGAGWNNLTNPTRLDPGRIPLSALDEPRFTEPIGGGFGGRRRVAGNDGSDSGQVELRPHNVVHSSIGGFMGDPTTAGLDPIFWLHHANIDRLWETWLRRGRSNPTNERDWMTQSWTMGAGTARTQLRTSDVLVTTAAPLGYQYAVLEDPPPRPRPTPEFETEIEAPWVAETRPPEVVGASEAPIPIGSRISVATVAIARPQGPTAREMADETGPKPGTRVHVRLENVTATRIGADLVDVYLNVPDPARARDFPEHRIGTLPMFGVLSASKRDDRHSGSGTSVTFEITDLVRQLRGRGQWNPQQLRVSFVPVPDASGRVPEGDVAVGRVSLLYS